jgi:hypothetical protein
VVLIATQFAESVAAVIIAAMNGLQVVKPR